MTRAAAIARAHSYFDSGTFRADLARRVAIPTESQNPERAPDLARYLESEIQPALEKLGFAPKVSLKDGIAEEARWLRGILNS